MIEEIKEAFKNYVFVSVEFENGHQHTIKAYGTHNIDPVTLEKDFEANMRYIKYVENNEHTEVWDVLFSNDEEEAKEREIITEDGGFL